MSWEASALSAPSAVGFQSLLDTHRRIRFAAPIVSLVTARSRTDARTAYSRWVRATGARVVVSPRPTAEAALSALRAQGQKGLAVLFVGSELPALWREARAFSEAEPECDVALVARATEVVRLLTDPEASAAVIVSLLQGLVPVDPVEEEVIARVVAVRRLAPLLRSPQEGLLYFLLESRRETRGLFDANQRLPRSAGGSWEVDLYARGPQLVVEIDGGQHDAETQRIRDEEKERDLRALGIEIVRFSAAEVARAPVDVWESIVRKV